MTAAAAAAVAAAKTQVKRLCPLTFAVGGGLRCRGGVAQRAGRGGDPVRVPLQPSGLPAQGETIGTAFRLCSRRIWSLHAVPFLRYRPHLFSALKTLPLLAVLPVRTDPQLGHHDAALEDADACIGERSR